MGKHQLRLLKFAIKYPGWHSYSIDRVTVKTIISLVEYGLLVVNERQQFKLNTGNKYRFIRGDR